MTNAWSLLYDELKMDEYPYPDNFGQETPGAVTFNIEMNNDPNRYKYDEDAILKELTDYISGTYNQHYSAGDDKIQTLDLIEAVVMVKHSADPISSSMPLAYDKKGTARRDIMKILHYAVLLMHFNDKNAKRETYPQ